MTEVKKWDYMQGKLYSTDNEKEFELSNDIGRKELRAYLNELEYNRNEDSKEIARLYKMMAVCHEDIRDLSKNLDKERKLKNIYRDMAEWCFEATREMDR